MDNIVQCYIIHGASERERERERERAEQLVSRARQFWGGSYAQKSSGPRDYQVNVAVSDRLPGLQAFFSFCVFCNIMISASLIE